MTKDVEALGDTPRTLASQLKWLFDTVRPVVQDDEGKPLPYSQTKQRHHNTDLARHLRVSPAYVSQLRNGRRTNATADVLRGIATFFDISATYFLSDEAEAARVEAEIQYGVDLRRYEDGELAAPPVKPSVAGPHQHLGGEVPGSAAVLGERLSWLFSNVQSAAANRPYTDEEVAEAIGEKSWVVRGLRTGEMTDSDVTAAVLRKLAAFFDRPLSYLYGDEHDAQSAGDDEELLDLLRAAKENKTGLLGLALRTLESGNPAHSGVRNQATQRVLATLIRSHLEFDKELSESASASPVAPQPDEAGR